MEQYRFLLENVTTGKVIKDCTNSAEDTATLGRKALYALDVNSRPGRKGKADVTAEADASELAAA